MTKEEAKQWIESIKRKYIHGGDEEFDYKRKIALDMAIKALEQESKTGHWVEHEKGYWSQVNEEGERDGWIPMYECSECGSQGWMDKENYCPNCGAKMSEREASDDK